MTVAFGDRILHARVAARACLVEIGLRVVGVRVERLRRRDRHFVAARGDSGIRVLQEVVARSYFLSIRKGAEALLVRARVLHALAVHQARHLHRLQLRQRILLHLWLCLARGQSVLARAELLRIAARLDVFLTLGLFVKHLQDSAREIRLVALTLSLGVDHAQGWRLLGRVALSGSQVRRREPTALVEVGSRAYLQIALNLIFLLKRARTFLDLVERGEPIRVLQHLCSRPFVVARRKHYWLTSCVFGRGYALRSRGHLLFEDTAHDLVALLQLEVHHLRLVRPPRRDQRLRGIR